MKSDSKAGRLLGVKGAKFSAETDAQLFSRAQKELAAFVAAVTTLHGEEQARAAADDWLLELIALKEPCNGAFLDLRSVTIGAAIRLALRFSIPSPAAIRINKLMELGFHKPGDVENRLGYHVGRVGR